MKLAWLTDIHLSHVDKNKITNLVQNMNNLNVDAFIITGDIAEATSHPYYLTLLEQQVKRKLYVVLGNHDYYGSSIKEVRDNMKQVQNNSSYIRYLPNVTYDKLTPTTALIGHDCWYDAINGNQNTQMVLNDFRFIRDYYDITGGDIIHNFNKYRQPVIELSRQLSRVGAEHIHHGIKEAVKFAKTIVIASHPTPFQESHIFNGQIGDPSAQPWFTSKLLGDLLLSAAKTYPNIRFISLSGHTHGEFHGNILPNLEVHVGGAEYSNPIIQKTIFEF